VRGLSIVWGIALLGPAVWAVTAGASGRGPHGPPLHWGHAGHMKPGGGHHPGQMGIFFPVEPAHQFMERVAGEPGPGPAFAGRPTLGEAGGGAEHMIGGRLSAPAVRPLAYITARGDHGEDVTPQSVPASAAEKDNQGGATAQPNPPTARPWPQRPPGAAGPGRPLSGWWGPGLPGPGRPPTPLE
jgi:hypothetical protein